MLVGMGRAQYPDTSPSTRWISGVSCIITLLLILLLLLILIVIPGLVVPNQEFAEVTDASGLGAAYSLGKFDGILGMAWPILSVNDVPMPFENLVNLGLLDSAEFAFYLGNSRTDKGELTLGGTDPNHYTGPITWVPLLAKTYWEITLDDLVVSGTSYVNRDQHKAIVDSGTSILTGPADQVSAIANSLGTVYYGYYYLHQSLITYL